MFERFTDRARRVLVYAQEEATLLDHSYIGTEHILLGVLADGQDGEHGAAGVDGVDGVAATALASFGITLEAARRAVRETVGAAATISNPGSPPFTPRSKTVLELSLGEALLLGHGYIGTAHLLLGLVREGEGVAAQVMVGLGAEPGLLRQRVLELIEATARADGYPYADLEGEAETGPTLAMTRSAGPVPEVSPSCRCGADWAEAAAYRSIEVPAAPGEVDRGLLPTTVVFCRHCGYLLGQARPGGGR
jgi:ATP-dependent Clp protease ATP-binding subunit ClpC